MRLEVSALPEPGPGQVLVEVKAAGVNLFDTQLRSGLYKRDLPLGLGLEGAGIVDAVGQGVADIKTGDRVAFIFLRAPMPRTRLLRRSVLCRFLSKSVLRKPPQSCSRA